MEQTIDVQKAKKNEALNFDEVNKNFTEYIYENCQRNIFRKDNSINYMNYKQFIYDFDSIEKYLGEIILPGKLNFLMVMKNYNLLLLLMKDLEVINQVF